MAHSSGSFFGRFFTLSSVVASLILVTHSPTLDARLRQSTSSTFANVAAASFGRTSAAEEPPTPSTPDLEAEDTARRGRPAEADRE